HNISPAIGAVLEAGQHGFAGIQLQNFPQVGELTASDFRQPVFVLAVLWQKEQVHGPGGLSWWLSASSAASGAPGFSTRRPKKTPASKSSHMGMASRVWEIISGGVSSIPTTKQPTKM